MSGKFELGDYVEVKDRMAQFFAKHPEGSLREHLPFRIVTVGDKTFVAYTAAAYRSPDDPAPGIGSAWELVPGKTPYTKDSELQNAETSAWGRAILAANAADTTKGIASREEVQGRSQSRQSAPRQQRSAPAGGDRKREVVTRLQALGLSTAGNLEALEARLAEATAEANA